MPISPIWPAATAVNAEGSIEFHGRTAESLLDEFGSPLYLIDTDEVVARARHFVRAAAEAFNTSTTHVSFAGKAFLSKEVVRLVTEAGMFVDTCTMGEMKIALAAGVPGRRLVLHGNNKSDEEIALAIEQGFAKIVIDEPDEPERVAAIARKLGVDPMLAILTAGGTGICGAAAVMGLAGSIKVPEDKQDEKDNDVTMAVAIVAIMGTVFALLEIALGPLAGMTKDQLGITAGASLHEIAHAVAAGDAFGAVDIATIMKLSRVLMLVFAAIIIAIWWEKKHSEVENIGKKTVAFPWFMLGFIGASIIGTFVPLIASITPQLVDFAYIVLGMAMAALGINVNFKAIASKGKKPMLASFLTSILLMCFAAGVAVLFF